MLKKAGVTTGAIYTRYKGKDELFYSLIEEFLKALNMERKENENSYKEYSIDKNLDHFLKSIEKERIGYIDILFKYYEKCKLLLCCSNGSSVEAMFCEMMKNKISKTKTFIKENIDSDISELKLDLVELLMSQQFNAYTLIIEKGYSKYETYETQIGEAGNTLSGGEKQRIAIARAILKDSPIVILDEFTSALDVENEYHILQAINNLVQNKTVIMIAHRLETVRKADNIIVLDKGEIAQEGTHNELISQDGIYKSFISIRERANTWRFK